jgi:hypothetical protein
MSVVNIPVPKAGGSIEIELDDLASADFPEHVYKEIMFQGLKVLLNRGMSKITGAKTDGSKKAAMEIAEKNLLAVRKGEIRLYSGKRPTKATGAINVEAMRLARIMVKDAMKRAGMKVSHYPAKEITAAAKLMLEGDQGPGILAQAEAAIKEREEKENQLAIDLSGLKADPKLVADAEKKAAESRAATKAKKARAAVAQRSRPGVESRATH